MSQSNIHIGIDGNEANVKKRVGSNRYAYEIIKSLQQADPESRYTVYLKNQPLHDMPKENKNWTYRVLKPQKLWTQWRLPLDLYLKFTRPDVFYSPGHYAPRFTPVPTVVTILDLAFLRYPNLFLRYKRGTAQLTSWTAYSVKNSSHVITISQASKKDIIKFYNTPDNQITVAYPGVDTNELKPATTKEISQVKQTYNLGNNYILYLGTIQPRKNLVRLLAAFERLPPRYKKYNLVIAGSQGWMTQDFVEALNRSSKKSQVVLTGFVKDQDVPALYSGASCLCLVGIYEGFGIPPIEALACGTLPVVSEVSSLPEVVGNKGITVDPFSVASISHGIETALSLTLDKKEQLIKSGQSHIKKFDWQQSAKIIKEVLHDVAIQG